MAVPERAGSPAASVSPSAAYAVKSIWPEQQRRSLLDHNVLGARMSVRCWTGSVQHHQHKDGYLLLAGMLSLFGALLSNANLVFKHIIP